MPLCHHDQKMFRMTRIINCHQGTTHCHWTCSWHCPPRKKSQESSPWPPPACRSWAIGSVNNFQSMGSLFSISFMTCIHCSILPRHATAWQFTMRTDERTATGISSMSTIPPVYKRSSILVLGFFDIIGSLNSDANFKRDELQIWSADLASKLQRILVHHVHQRSEVKVLQFEITSFLASKRMA